MVVYYGATTCPVVRARDGGSSNAMAFQPTTNGARIVVEWNSSTQGNWTNTYWASKSGFTTTDQTLLAQEIAASLQNDDITRLATTCGFALVRVIDERTEGAPQSIVVDASGGSASGDQVPLSVAVCVTLRTALRGRAYRGRSYIGGFVESQIAGNLWSNDAVDQALDIVSNIVDACSTTGWTIGVRSGQLNGVRREAAVVTPLTTHIVRSNIVTSQRRRVSRP